MRPDLFVDDEVKQKPKPPSNKWRNWYCVLLPEGIEAIGIQDEREFPDRIVVTTDGMLPAQTTWPSYQVAEQQAIEFIGTVRRKCNLTGVITTGAEPVLSWDRAEEE